MSNDLRVALHDELLYLETDGGGACVPRESRSLRGARVRIKGLVEDLPGAGFAGPTAGSHAGAGLKLLEGVRAFLDGLRQALFRDAVADADVHGWILGANASVAMAVLQIIRIYVFSAMLRHW
jgi:hypothetical protein